MGKPLLGKRIVITRARGQAAEFSQLLAGYGAHVVEFPTIKIVPPDSWYPVDRAIETLETYHVFPSLFIPAILSPSLSIPEIVDLSP